MEAFQIGEPLGAGLVVLKASCWCVLRWSTMLHIFVDRRLHFKHCKIWLARPVALLITKLLLKPTWAESEPKLCLTRRLTIAFFRGL